VSEAETIAEVAVKMTARAKKDGIDAPGEIRARMAVLLKLVQQSHGDPAKMVAALA
jgi:hypothetical protein